MSDVFQSGGPPVGRTFNLMAGLETPTPAQPVRRISAQTPLDNSMQYNVDEMYANARGLSTQPSTLSSSTQWNPSSQNNGISPWPGAQQGARNSMGARGQSTGPVSSLASWNHTQPYSTTQPSPIQSRATLHSNRNPSIDR